MGQQIASPASLGSLPEKRSKLITTSCVFGFIIMFPFLVGLYAIAIIFFRSGNNPLINSYAWINPFIVFLGLMGLVGYWKMRKWGVYVYTTMSIISIAYMLIIGMPTLYVHIFSLVVVSIGFANLRKMT